MENEEMITARSPFCFTSAPSSIVPSVPRLASRILALLEDGARVHMPTYHECEAVHCMAGWATFLAGAEGKRLEEGELGYVFDTWDAGALIWMKTYGAVPRFSVCTSDTEVMEDLRRFAAQDPEPSP